MLRNILYYIVLPDSHTILSFYIAAFVCLFTFVLSRTYSWLMLTQELFGQMIHTVLGPLSTPVLLLLYGGKVGLDNRAFWPLSPLALTSFPTRFVTRQSFGQFSASTSPFWMSFQMMSELGKAAVPRCFCNARKHHLAFSDNRNCGKFLATHWRDAHWAEVCLFLPIYAASWKKQVQDFEHFYTMGHRIGPCLAWPALPAFV